MVRKRSYSSDTASTSNTTKSLNASRSQPRSKLARENNISAAQEHEIKEAFSLFAESSPNSSRSSKSNNRKGKSKVNDTSIASNIHVNDLRRVLTALCLTPTPTELKEYISILDPEGEGYIEYEPFVAICALKIHSRIPRDVDHQREVDEAWSLFVREGEDRITLASLREVARALGDETVSDELLRDMVLEANGGTGLSKGVGKEEFEIVMRRAGVWQ